MTIRALRLAGFLTGLLLAGIAAAADAKLFAVEIRTGPAWDPDLEPLEQPHFRAHGAHLGSLREAGVIRFGARYREIGLLMIAAADEAGVRELLDPDPSMQAGTFTYSIAPANVFYEWRDEAEP